MMIRTLFTAALASLTVPVFSQVSSGGTPHGLEQGWSLQHVNSVHAIPFDAAGVSRQDAQRAREGKIPAYGRVLPLEADLFRDGTPTDLPNGDRVWRLRLASPGALATELYFSDFFMPKDAVLYVYSMDGADVLGGFSAQNNREDATFGTSLIAGEECVIEYRETAAVAGQGRVHLSAIGHAYRDVEEITASGACEVDVNCSEGNNWTHQRDAVVRVGVVDSGFNYWCTGALVNNLAMDCKPYFLTALHCGLSASMADLNQWRFYFNYERPNCNSGGTAANRTMLGAKKRGSSNDGGGDSGSDFLLLEANSATIPANYHPYWAGWDASGSGSSSGVGIHHPSGDYKKISTYTSNTGSISWGGVPGTHWRVFWAATANGHGVTEGGSSGSPLFNQAKRIIGTLTGGTSSCSNTGGFDAYGKMSYHWQSNPGPTNQRLKRWLDPQSTGLLRMDGSYDPCGEQVGVAELAARPGRLELYPNPASDHVVAVLPGGLQSGALLQVFDMGGREVLSLPVDRVQEMRFHTSHLDGGAYVVRIRAEGHVLATAPLIVMGH